MLTDAKIRKAQPGEKDYKLTDEKGLVLLVRPNGSKLWRHRYQLAGKEKMASYGPYPEVTLKEAREKRDAARAILREGGDPMMAKRRAKAVVSNSAHTFESLAREWHDMNQGRWADVHAADVLRSLERDVFPMLGEFPIQEIDAPLILACLRMVEKRGAIETAKRLRQRISAVFVYGISNGLVATDPAAIVDNALRPIPKRRRQPAITDLEELRALLRAVESSAAYPVTILASRFLALTAQRPGTVRRARWEDMQEADGIWHIPAEQMKLSLERKDDEAFDHIVPLTPQALDVLRAVRVLSGRCELVFPGQRHAHKPLSENAIGYLYNRAGWHGRHVPHGWRAAFSTLMNEWARKHGRADDRAVIDLMLAHQPSNKIEAAYNRAEFRERRREIAQAWADMLTEGLQEPEVLLTLARRH